MRSAAEPDGSAGQMSAPRWERSPIVYMLQSTRQPQALPWMGARLLTASTFSRRDSNRPVHRTEAGRFARRPNSPELGVAENIGGQAARPISTGKLRALPHFHIRPINHVVYVGSSGALRLGTPNLEGGFPLRCFQRLSLPNIATRRCRWRDNRNTRGSSNSVLSY